MTLWLKKRSEKSERGICSLFDLNWSRYQSWKRRRRSSESLNDAIPGPAPRLDAPLPEEIDAVIEHALSRPKDGYRRLTWQMVDENVAYLTESTVYRILDERNLLCRWKPPSRSSGSAPARPTAPNQRWHTDIMYLQVNEVWYFLVSFIDAYSRYIVHWELLRTMTSDEISLATLCAFEKYPDARPEVVTDRGTQYTSREFKKLVKRFEIEHILCRVRHPQSNGIIERYHRSTRESLQEVELRDLGQARRVIAAWVEDYNENRLHAGLHYLKPSDYFRGNPRERLAERREKLATAKERRIRENQKTEKRKVDQDRKPNPVNNPKSPFENYAVGSI